MPWNSPAVAKRQAVSSSVKRARSAGLGRSSWVRMVNGQAGPERGGGLVHGPPAREQGQRAPAGRVDQRLQLVVHAGPVAGLAGIGEVGGAVQEGVGLVVERAADVEHVGALGRQPDPLGQVQRDGGGGEDGRAPGPHALASTGPTSSGATASRGWRRRPPTHATCPRAGERGVEVLGQRDGRLLGADSALVGVGHVGRDGPQRGQQGSTGRRPCGERVADGVGQRAPGAAADVGREGVGQPVPASARGAEQLVVVDDPAGQPGQVGEAAGAEATAGGVGDDVLELVGLVDHDHVVLGQDRAAGADVEAVEVGVDDDDVGRRGPAAGRLGEALFAERAAASRPGHSSLVTLTAAQARSLGFQSSSARSPVAVVAAHAASRSTSVARPAPGRPARAGPPGSRTSRTRCRHT